MNLILNPPSPVAGSREMKKVLYWSPYYPAIGLIIVIGFIGSDYKFCISERGKKSETHYTVTTIIQVISWLALIILLFYITPPTTTA